MRHSSRINDRGPRVRGRLREPRVAETTIGGGRTNTAEHSRLRRSLSCLQRTTVVGPRLRRMYAVLINKAHCCCASDRGRILQSYKPARSICKHTTHRPETKRVLQTYVVLVGQNDER